jgi:predicted nucleic acid-binding protein
VYEVFKRLLQTIDEESALQVIGIMSLGQEVVLDRQIAREAAKISIDEHLAMADSIILASARLNQATLWTQDAHFKDVAGVQFVEN